MNNQSNVEDLKYSDTDDDCSSTELKPPEWQLFCEEGEYALLYNGDHVKRCACKKGGKYFWTYGHYCKYLPCYDKPCPK